MRIWQRKKPKRKKKTDCLAATRWLDGGADSDEIKLHSMANKSKIQFQWHTTRTHRDANERYMYFVLCLYLVLLQLFLSPGQSERVCRSVCFTSLLFRFIFFCLNLRFAFNVLFISI